MENFKIIEIKYIKHFISHPRWDECFICVLKDNDSEKTEYVAPIDVYNEIKSHIYETLSE